MRKLRDLWAKRIVELHKVSQQLYNSLSFTDDSQEENPETNSLKHELLKAWTALTTIASTTDVQLPLTESTDSETETSSLLSLQQVQDSLNFIYAGLGSLSNYAQNLGYFNEASLLHTSQGKMKI